MRSIEAAALATRFIEASSRRASAPCQRSRSVARSMFSGFSFIFFFSSFPRKREPSKGKNPGPRFRGDDELEHRQIKALLARAVDGDLVAGVSVAHHAGSGVVPQHPLESPCGVVRAVGDDHHSRMLRIAHTDTAA